MENMVNLKLALQAMTGDHDESIQILIEDIDNWSRLVTTVLIIH